jgi:hypothetical protein
MTSLWHIFFTAAHAHDLTAAHLFGEQQYCRKSVLDKLSKLALHHFGEKKIRK